MKEYPLALDIQVGFCAMTDKELTERVSACTWYSLDLVMWLIKKDYLWHAREFEIEVSDAQGFYNYPAVNFIYTNKATCNLDNKGFRQLSTL